MKTIKGPAIFLAQFAGPDAPFNTLPSIARWAADKGFIGVQMPTSGTNLFDLEKAASSDAYCDEVKGILKDAGIVITELSTHLQGQLVAVHPAYDTLFDGFAPARVHGNPKARQEWAVDQLLLAAKASQRLGLAASVTFSGALAWPYFYPWPQRPAGLIEAAFSELAKRWKPILDFADQHGVVKPQPTDKSRLKMSADRILRPAGNFRLQPGPCGFEGSDKASTVSLRAEGTSRD
jgi:sugar phosphate isomerase/epimerase